MPLYKRCSRCGKRISSGSSCDCSNRRYAEEDNYTKDDPCKRFYKTSEWTAARDRARNHCNGIDVYQLYTTGTLQYGSLVHHIIPLRECWERRTDPNNLIYLTDESHQKIHAALKAGGAQKREITAECFLALKWYDEKYCSG